MTQPSPAAPTVFLTDQLTPAHQVATIKRSILQNGTFGAVLFVLAAALANHVRRVLVPWLGQYVWWHALENMKFATCSPHYFLEASLSFAWSEVLFWICWTVAGYFVSTSIQDGFVAGDDTSHDQKDSPPKPRQVPKGNQEVALGIQTMLHMAMRLTLMERYYTQTCFCAAYIYAFSRLVVYGGAAERAFLWNCLAERWLHAAFQCGLVLYWACSHFLPTARNVLGATVAGKPALGVVHGVVWGGTAYLVRYSSKYFLLLELSDVLVTLGWITVGFATVFLLKMEMISGWRDAKERECSK